MNSTRHNHLFEPMYGETKTKINFLKSKIKANQIKREVERDEWRDVGVQLRGVPNDRGFRLWGLPDTLRKIITKKIGMFARRDNLRA